MCVLQIVCIQDFLFFFLASYIYIYIYILGCKMKNNKKGLELKES
jgi:hypothetical protein